MRRLRRLNSTTGTEDLVWSSRKQDPLTWKPSEAIEIDIKKAVLNVWTV